ncbi:fimbrial protein [Serratia oryzae]|uniref:Fimbrial-type adhesion domain-containing protein n=1 Tax=Serratia oryzae TaxID=2034155 RepID=A0A1S8CG81_9GAMM|nr:fimbrial protein [Serratia oryzae]OMQ20799.1 hypothetical protein BMI79_16895 [Serratia oryzae]
MKLTKLALAAVLAFGVTSVANADQGSGKVNFKGSIIDAPCSIAPESLDQTVDLGAVANTALVNGGMSAEQPFDIKLIKCDLSGTKNKVKAAFAGALGGATGTTVDMLGIAGGAKGASIVLFDGSNKQIKLDGTTTTGLQNLIGADNVLHFSSALKGHDGVALAGITEGGFTAVATFALYYE